MRSGTRGSTFAVRVPFAATADDVPVVERKTSEPMRIAGLRVLCLDNDGAVLEALDAALRSRRCVPLLAATIARAMELAVDEEPDIALIDFHLGDAEDGLDVAARLAKLRPAPAIALVTADRSVAEDTRVGGFAILNKPVVPADLWEFIERASAAASKESQSLN